MCDTMGKIGSGVSFFAKNSDRSPNEVQVLEYHSANENLSGTVDCTYISVPQAAQTHAVLLSRPSWMWGAEMGVNEFGLCIGNEAVFTKGAYGKIGLTGMDMVRLGLERSRTAKEALELLISLLETYGQGGNCGFDHDFYYDNGFLIMDRSDIYVLETCGKKWTYRRSAAANISNRLSVGTDADACRHGKIIDFRKRYTEPVYTAFSASAKRYAQMNGCLSDADSAASCMAALRSHDKKVKNPFAKGSVGSVCMHYGAMVGDHTTSSMVVSLEPDRTIVWSTGSSLPCVSLFKPWLFGTETVLPVTLPDDPTGRQYWLDAERFRRSLLSKKLPAEFYEQRDAVQQSWLEKSAGIADEDFTEFSRSCLLEETAFFEKWKEQPLPKASCSAGFNRRWNKKNKVLFS